MPMKTDSVEYASSAKRRSCILTIFRLRLPLRLFKLISRPSVLVQGLIPVAKESKASFNTIKKKIPNEVKASTQPCFTPL